METENVRAVSSLGEVFAGLTLAAPEVLLTLFLVLVLLADLLPAWRRQRAAAWLALAGIAVALAATVRLFGHPETTFFSGMVALDSLALFFKLISLVATGLAVIFSIGSKALERQDHGEYYALLLSTAIGINLMAASRNLLMVYVSLEMVSLASYALVAYLRRNRESSEAGLKYILFGAVASAVMIFGMSYVYGLTGSLSFDGIRSALAGMAAGNSHLAVGISLIMILAGIGYKIAAVPFHLWCPDVYQGAPTPITAFLSVGPKAAGFALFIRLFFDAFAGPVHGMPDQWTALTSFNWPMLVAVISALTMTLGNLAAIPQNNLKRMLAYSSIAHAGYMMMPLVILTREGVESILFYLAIYLLMNLGAFLVVLALENRSGHPSITGFRGLAWNSPTGAFMAICMTIFLVSLTGIPPMGGFAAKFKLFGAIIAAEQFYWLALLGVLNSAVSLFYYMRVVKAMFFTGNPVKKGHLVEREVAFGERSQRTLFAEELSLRDGGVDRAPALERFDGAPFGRLHAVIIGALAALVLLMGLAWNPLERLSEISARFIL
jgi:NADH-quinone oxidoreductase subunit N